MRWRWNKEVESIKLKRGRNARGGSVSDWDERQCVEMRSARKEEGHDVACPYKKKDGMRDEGLALRSRSGGSRGGTADGVAVDDEFDAPIALAAFGGVVGGDRLRFAEAVSGDGRRRYALFGEEIADGAGAALGKLLIEFVAADAVGVALDLEQEAGMREDDAGNFGEFFAGAGLERVAAGVEKHVRHVDDKAAGGVAGLQDGIQMGEKLGAKLSRFGFGLRGLLARFLGVLATLHFSDGSGAGLGFAFFGGFLVPGNFRVGVFFGFLFYGHDAGFFRGFHDFAGGGDDGFLVALAPVDFFRVPELQFGLGERRSGVFVGERDVCDANGVAGFKKFERGLAVYAKDGVFDFGVGRRVDAAAEKFVAGVNVFDLAEGRGTKDVFENHGVARLGDGEVRFGGDDHAEGLHVGNGFDFASAVFEDHFAEVDGTASGRHGPENVGEIFEAELGSFVEAEEFCVDLRAAALVLHSGISAGLLHQFGALKIDLGGAGAAVIDRFGGARNIFGGAGGRSRLAERRSSQDPERPG